MKKEPFRKTDRRTLYTKMVIKDALLELMEEHSFDKITVTAICKIAEITRATFYLHFNDLTAVVDELLVEALELAGEMVERPNDDMIQSLRLLASGKRDPEKLKSYDALLPVCQRVADLPKYRVLFLDESLSGYIIKTMFRSEKKKMIPLLIQNCHLTAPEAESLFMFVVYGSFMVNKRLGWEKTKEWYEVHDILLRFVFGGIEALR